MYKLYLMINSFNNIPQELYLADAAQVVTVKSEKISENEKIFVKAVFPRDNFPYFPDPHKGEGEVLSGGYRLKKGDTEITLQCCNFTDKDVFVKICSEAKGAVLRASEGIRLKAGEEARVGATISFEEDGDMWIYLDADGLSSKTYFTLQELK